jgi:topoisomerase-4 subunit A
MSQKTINQVGVFYREWFLDYASYVILERAVPHINDGLKPVQRRILHSLYEMDDGRFNKVANVVGHSMRYHPHGDASIYEALVAMGQKRLLVETQGNWGNILTGDGAAAARYIEARLSGLAKEVAFNPSLTPFIPSYDGRGKEPVTLPMKIPLLLLQGVEGIAVGLACKILPHNFAEVCNAAAASLEGREFALLPDFPTGGLVDAGDYNDGRSGGKVKVRARIELEGKDKLVITELPAGVVASTLMESIEKAVAKGKIKIKKIEDYISKKVRIVLHLPSGVPQETTRDALFAFTVCESSISVNACVIQDQRPRFLSVSDLLHSAAQTTLSLLKKELEIKLAALEEDWHRMKLEEIFIREKIYQKFEKAASWEEILNLTLSSVKKFSSELKRPPNEDDARRLTDIRVKRISKFDADEARRLMDKNEAAQEETKSHLADITGYTVAYFRKLAKEYGPAYPRRTEIEKFGSVVASDVASANVKLYANLKEGFVGHSMKKDDFVCDCSDIDDVLAIGGSAWMKVERISAKTYMGPNLEAVTIWKKSDTKVYNMLYEDAATGTVYAKRFQAGSITRGREYQLSKSKGSRVLFLEISPDEKTPPPKVRINLSKVSGVRKTELDFDFASIAIKGREAGGNIASRHKVASVSRLK